MKKITGLAIFLLSIQLLNAQVELIEERFDYDRNSQLLLMSHADDQPVFLEKIGLYHITLPEFKRQQIMFILDGGNPEMNLKPATRYKIDYEVNIFPRIYYKEVEANPRATLESQQITTIENGIEVTAYEDEPFEYHFMRTKVIFDENSSPQTSFRALRFDDFKATSTPSRDSISAWLNSGNRYKRKEALSFFHKPNLRPSTKLRYIRLFLNDRKEENTADAIWALTKMGNLDFEALVRDLFVNSNNPDIIMAAANYFAFLDPDFVRSTIRAKLANKTETKAEVVTWAPLAAIYEMKDLASNLLAKIENLDSTAIRNNGYLCNVLGAMEYSLKLMNDDALGKAAFEILTKDEQRWVNGDENDKKIALALLRISIFYKFEDATQAAAEVMRDNPFEWRFEVLSQLEDMAVYGDTDDLKYLYNFKPIFADLLTKKDRLAAYEKAEILDLNLFTHGDEASQKKILDVGFSDPDMVWNASEWVGVLRFKDYIPKVKKAYEDAGLFDKDHYCSVLRELGEECEMNPQPKVTPKDKMINDQLKMQKTRTYHILRRSNNDKTLRLSNKMIIKN
ncbi:MAG: hypothetical protein AAFO07_04870 [Bacteroidota bacterium]